MSLYEGLIAVLLLAAIPLNMGRIADLSLVLITAFFLLLASSVIPPADLLQTEWFVLLMAIEAAFAAITLCLATSTPVKYAVAGFCLWNFVGHGFGLAAYYEGWEMYEGYAAIIRGGEIGQVCALLLFSRPVWNNAVQRIAERQGGSDGWLRMGSA